MFCSKCGNKNSDNAEFCTGCGTQISTNIKESNSSKFGNLRKCPACNAPVSAFSTTCTDCGHEFSGIEASKTIKALYEALDSIGKERESIQLSGILTSLASLEDKDKYRDNVIQKRCAAVIRDFPIPNSRDELLELIHFIHPKVTEEARNSPNYDDWKMKFGEVLTRAKTAFKNDRAIIEQIGVFESKLKRSATSYFTDFIVAIRNFIKWCFKTKLRGIFMIFIIFPFMVLMIALIFDAAKEISETPEHKQNRIQLIDESIEKRRLEGIQTKVNELFTSKRFDEAIFTAEQLKWGLSTNKYNNLQNDNMRKSWDEQRAKIIEGIKTAQKNAQ